MCRVMLPKRAEPGGGQSRALDPPEGVDLFSHAKQDGTVPARRVAGLHL